MQLGICCCGRARDGRARDVVVLVVVVAVVDGVMKASSRLDYVIVRRRKKVD